MASGHAFEAEALAISFVRPYQRDKRSGYPSWTRAHLANARSGRDFIDVLPDSKKAERTTDGSAMRAVPIGLYPTVDEVKRNAMINSRISHTHPYAVSASMGVALASHFYYYDLGSNSEIISYILPHIREISQEVYEYLVTMVSLDLFDPATILGTYEEHGPPFFNAKLIFGSIVSILKYYGDNPHAAILETIRLGGDVDTTLSIILGIVLMHHPIDVLPQDLYLYLENSNYGRPYLENLGNLLHVEYPGR